MTRYLLGWAWLVGGLYLAAQCALGVGSALSGGVPELVPIFGISGAVFASLGIVGAYLIVVRSGS